MEESLKSVEKALTEGNIDGALQQTDDLILSQDSKAFTKVAARRLNEILKRLGENRVASERAWALIPILSFREMLAAADDAQELAIVDKVYEIYFGNEKTPKAITKHYAKLKPMLEEAANSYAKAGKNVSAKSLMAIVKLMDKESLKLEPEAEQSSTYYLKNGDEQHDFTVYYCEGQRFTEKNPWWPPRKTSGLVLKPGEVCEVPVNQLLLVDTRRYWETKEGVRGWLCIPTNPDKVVGKVTVWKLARDAKDRWSWQFEIKDPDPKDQSQIKKYQPPKPKVEGKSSSAPSLPTSLLGTSIHASFLPVSLLRQEQRNGSLHIAAPDAIMHANDKEEYGYLFENAYQEEDEKNIGQRLEAVAQLELICVRVAIDANLVCTGSEKGPVRIFASEAKGMLFAG